MKRLISFCLALATLGGFVLAPAVSAEDEQPAAKKKQRVNARQVKQRERIKDGLKNKSLTRKEAKKLRKQQKKIREKEAKMRQSGGKLTKKERAKLEKMQDKASKNIKKQKSDKQTRN